MARIIKIDLLNSQRLRLRISVGGAYLVEHGSFDLHYVHVPFGAPPQRSRINLGLGRCRSTSTLNPALCRGSALCVDHWKRETASAQPRWRPADACVTRLT